MYTRPCVSSTNYVVLIVTIINLIWLSFFLSLAPVESCFGCFDMNVTMTPPFLIRRAVPSCKGFWEHEPATAASDMPDFPLSRQSGFSYTLPFSLQRSFILIFCSFLNTSFVPLLLHFYLFLILLPSLHISSSPCCPSLCSRVLALVVVKAALPLKTVCLNEKGDAGGREGAEGHS